MMIARGSMGTAGGARWRRAASASTVGVIALALSMAPSVRAERVAVLPVETRGDPMAVELATAMRDALAKSSTSPLDVMDTATTATKITEQVKRGGASLQSYQARLDEAEERLKALDQNGSAAILAGVIDNMADDADFSVDAQKLLEAARLKLANRLLKLAGNAESGKGETKDGKRALDLLIAALRSNPSLTLSREEYPPKLHALLGLAREQLAARPKGSISIRARPEQAQVFVEGVKRGDTPTTIELAHGNYRVWIATPTPDGAVRSVTRTLETKKEPQPVTIDLVFEGAFWPEGPGLRFVPHAIFEERDAKRVGAVIGADTVILVGTTSYSATDGPYAWTAIVSVADGKARRHAVTKIDGRPASVLAPLFSEFVGGTDSVETLDASRPLPPHILPARAGTVSANNGATNGPSGPSPLDDVPWVPIGVIAGGVVLVGTAAAVTVALIVNAPREGQFTLRVTPAPADAP